MPAVSIAYWEGCFYQPLLVLPPHPFRLLIAPFPENCYKQERRLGTPFTQATTPIRPLSVDAPLAIAAARATGAAIGGVTARYGSLQGRLDPSERVLLSLLSGCAGAPEVRADWNQVAALAARLWLEPRLAVRAAANPGIPASLRQRWLEARHFTAARNLLFQSEEQRLLHALHQAGVEAIALKGTSLARILGDPAARPVTDIDLGVRAADVARAAAVLRDAGYSLSLPAALLAHRRFLAGTDEHTSEVKCTRDWGGSQLAVELHWKWLPLAESDVWGAMQTYQPSGVRTLGLEHYFLFLCAHAAGGRWAGLRWLCDIVEFLSVQGRRMDAALCLRLARQAGLRRAAGITLALLEDFFGVRFAELERLCDVRARQAARHFCRRPFEPFISGTASAIHRDRLGVQDTLLRRMAYAARLLRPTFREWADLAGKLRPAPAAWALRFTRLARLGVGSARHAPAAENTP